MHASSTETIAENYQGGIRKWLRRDTNDKTQLENQFNNIDINVASRASQTESDTDAAINRYEEAFIKILDDFGDKQVWDNVQLQVRAFGVDSPYVGQALQKGSSRSARDAMKKLIPAPKKQERPTSGSSYDFPTAEDFMKDSFAHGGSRPRRPSGQTTPPPRQEQLSDAEIEAKRIVTMVTGSDRQFIWLASEDIKNVMRVINTVKNLRNNAEKKGETISDRAIYIKYRRSIETDNPDEQLKKSFGIIDAFMGGKVSGKFPF